MDVPPGGYRSGTAAASSCHWQAGRGFELRKPAADRKPSRSSPTAAPSTSTTVRTAEIFQLNANVGRQQLWSRSWRLNSRPIQHQFEDFADHQHEVRSMMTGRDAAPGADPPVDDNQRNRKQCQRGIRSTTFIRAQVNTRTHQFSEVTGASGCRHGRKRSASARNQMARARTTKVRRSGRRTSSAVNWRETIHRFHRLTPVIQACDWNHFRGSIFLNRTLARV